MIRYRALQKPQPPAVQNASAVLPCLVVSDGKIVPEAVALGGLTEKKLRQVLQKEKKRPVVFTLFNG